MIHSEDRQRDPPFFRLPPELRNEIYRLLLGGITVHIGGKTESVPVRIGGVICRKPRCELRLEECRAGDSLEPLRHLTGAAHSQSSLLCTGGGDWAPCDKDYYRDAKPFSLDFQLLRVCRQMHDETALIPYAENNFIFDDGMDLDFRKAFRKRFNHDQRGAIQTAAVLDFEKRDIEAIPKVLRGVKHLWIRPYFRPGHLRRFKVEDFSQVVESFKGVENLKLAGAGFSYEYDDDDEEEEHQDLLERFEMALLG